MIKRILLTLLFPALLLSGTAVFAAPVDAQVDVSSEVCNRDDGVRPAICNDIDAGSGADANPIYGKDGVLTRAISVLSILTGIIAVIVMVIAGIKMSISQGDSGKISSARSQIIYAIVGVAVAVVAQGIVQLVLNRL